MVGTTRLARTALTGALISGALLLPALAQDGGPQLTFGVGQRFEASNNPDLEVVSPGTVVSSVTSLSFGLSDSTPISTLSLQASTGLRLRAGAQSGSDFEDQQLRLRYTRDGANAGLSVNADVRRADITYLRPLEDFIDDEGNFDLPEDLAALNGRGTRLSYGLNGTLEVGRDQVIGARFEAGISGLRYNNAPGLVDSSRTRLGATAVARVSPVLDAELGLNYSTYEARNAAADRSETFTTDLGLRYALSQTASLEAGLGYAQVNSRSNGIDARNTGLTARAALAYGLPNGDVTASLDSTINSSGRRYSFGLGRSMELPTGALSASIGATAAAGAAWQPTAGLNWRQDLPRGALSAQFSHDVQINSADRAVLVTALRVNYGYDINAVSGLNLGLGYAITGSDGTSNRVDRADLSVTYSRALTEDWSLEASYRHALRREAGVGTAQSNTVSLGIGREFNLRP